MASTKAETSEEYKWVDYKMYNGTLVERSLLTDEPIVKKKNGIIVSLSLIEREVSGIRLIIENSENMKGVIVGNLEIPFPENGDTKILVIPNIIELKLFNGGNPSSLVQTSSVSAVAQPQFKPKPTFADSIKISNVYGDTTKPKKRVINPSLPEALISVLKENGAEINKMSCVSCETKTNCILRAANALPDAKYYICGSCKRYLSLQSQYKCESCSGAVFIDGAGNACNKLCNKCNNV